MKKTVSVDKKRTKAVASIVSVNTIVVNFNHNGKEYHYLIEGEINTGDQVLVSTPNGYQVLTVVGVAPGRMPTATKWVVQKIDMDAYLLRMQNEERRTELKHQLISRMREIDETQKLEMYSKIDPAFKAIFDEMNSL